jgi:zeta-carotene desaturase
LSRETIVVGAGVAGLNAAASLAKAGVKVTVLERRPYVGGRAYSYLHPALDEVVDSQHVLLGCCTNLLEFCAEAGVAEKIRWYDEQTFLTPDGGASKIARSGLPVPMTYAGSFLRASMLGAGDKVAVARGLTGLMRGAQESDDESVAQWYKRTGQTERAVRHLWEPIVLATLNDNAESCSMRYAGKVFYEIFLKNAEGGRLGIPTVPLSDFYTAGVELVEARGGRVELRAGVEALTQRDDGRWELRTDDATHVADDVVLALPFEQTLRLMSRMSLQDDALQDYMQADLIDVMGRFVHSPFISILLWFDREISDLDHAWLLDATIQWFFHKSRIRRYAPGSGSYVELVIAGSRTELPKSRAEILEPALKELRRFFPEVAKAKLLKSGILKEARATFTVTPGLERSRPAQATGIPGLYLAGDWTRTDWPSTMEGAARSGRLAAGAVVGDPLRFLVPELPAEGVMRWLANSEKQ